jgi:hypothetical protein
VEKTKIKQGSWYETSVGFGECIKAGGCFPWSAQFRIVAPFPRGMVNVVPRDVKRELNEAEVFSLGKVHAK